MQRTPAGLPSGIPGMGDDMDGIIQQAPQDSLHSMVIGFKRMQKYQNRF